MDLDYDGLMIESHIHPDNAWSDAKQQITPETLSEMLSSLVVREDHEDDAAIQSDLDKLRQEITHIDEEILNLLSNRMKVAREIGSYKKLHNITILQQKRWNEVVEQAKVFAAKHGLGEGFVIKYLQAIHDESINQQEEIMSSE